MAIRLSFHTLLQLDRNTNLITGRNCSQTYEWKLCCKPAIFGGLSGNIRYGQLPGLRRQWGDPGIMVLSYQFDSYLDYKI